MKRGIKNAWKCTSNHNIPADGKYIKYETEIIRAKLLDCNFFLAMLYKGKHEIPMAMTCNIRIAWKLCRKYKGDKIY